MSKYGPYSTEALAELIEACAPSPLAQYLGAAFLLPADQRVSLVGAPPASSAKERLLLDAFNAYALHESDRLVTGSARLHQRAVFNRAYRKLIALDKPGK